LTPGCPFEPWHALLVCLDLWPEADADYARLGLIEFLRLPNQTDTQIARGIDRRLLVQRPQRARIDASALMSYSASRFAVPNVLGSFHARSR
jgi:hypothetical protein